MWMILIAAGLMLLSGCSSPPAASPRASSQASPSPTTDACAVQRQGPPSGNIAANFATALAFAPAGRLFWTERSGTVRVWQDGTARAFASVSTVTRERSGG
jgi:hypothetical protein